GDAVDNIPGIPGIGEKTAKKLVQEFGSVEGIIANSDQLKGKLRENVENYATQGLISKKLATIQLDVPIALEEDTLTLDPPNKEVLEPLFAELEFRTLGKRVFGDDFSVVESPGKSPSAQMDLFATTVEVSVQVEVEQPVQPAIPAKNVSNTVHEYTLVDTPEAMVALAEILSRTTSFCFDTESTGLDAMTAEMVGFSFATESGKAYYVPVMPD